MAAVVRTRKFISWSKRVLPKAKRLSKVKPVETPKAMPTQRLFETLGVFSRKDRLHQAILSFLPAQEREQHTLSFDERSPFAMRRQYDAVIAELKETPKGETRSHTNWFSNSRRRSSLRRFDEKLANVPATRFLKLKSPHLRESRDDYYRYANMPYISHTHRSYLSNESVELNHGGIFGNALAEYTPGNHNNTFIYRLSECRGVAGWRICGATELWGLPGYDGMGTKADMEKRRTAINKYLRQNGFKVKPKTDFRTLIRMLMSF